MAQLTSGSFTAGSQSSATFRPAVPGGGVSAAIALSLSGTFVADVSLQRSTDGGGTWATVGSANTAVGETFPSVGPEPADYRLRTTAYTSGTAVYRVGQ